MKRVVVIPLFLIFAVVIAWLQSGCSVDGNSSSTIRGTVLLPAQQVAQVSRTGLLARLRGLFISDLQADVVGLAPVANATVELVRLDNQGNVIAVIATTTSDASGNYSFTTNEPPSSDLAVRLPNEPAPTRAIVTQTNIDITPVSEAVVRSIIDEILNTGTVLGNYAVSEVKALVDLVNGMDIDVGGAATFDDAVNIVRTQAGSILTDMTAGYGTPGSVMALSQNDYALIGATTTLVPPPQFTPSSSAAIDHRAIDGALGFKQATPETDGGVEFGMLVLSDFASASYFCDASQLIGDRFVPASNGQVTVKPAQGGGAVMGMFSADNKLLIYPWTNTVAGVDGNATGIGRGIRFGFLTENTMPRDGVSLNPELNGNYNMVWSASYLSNGGGMGGGNAFSTATGSITLIFDPSTVDTEGQSALSSSNGTVSTLTLDLGNYTVSSNSGTDTVSGVYEVLPGNDVLAPLGDTGVMMGGGMGSGDFLQGMRVQVPDGQVSSLLAFSSWIAGGGMSGGGGMGMTAQCGDSGAGGMMGGSGGGMMGGAAGEGRGVALAALQEVGIDQAAISGTYNAVALITTLTEGTGTAFIETEVAYGTFTFDGAGNVSGSNLYFQRATMDAAAAAGGNTNAVSTATGSNNYTGTYSVSVVDGALTLNLTGLGTAAGFAARGGELMALPIEETATGTGRRGLLLLMRQP